MYGTLDATEIERILTTNQIGRLGVTGEGRNYIFPVSYGYHGSSVYIVSREGLKVRLMRAHPTVCFEVEEIASPAQWRTVIAHGIYEPIEDATGRAQALSIIASQGPSPLPPSIAPYLDGPERVVAIRIRLHEKTGRFEHDQIFTHVAP